MPEAWARGRSIPLLFTPVSSLVLGASILAAPAPASELPGSDCNWSPAWQAIKYTGEGPGELTPPRRRKGALERPRPNPGEHFDIDGPWILSAVVDAKGRVIDARILKSAADPPWPRYEEQLLKGFRKWEFVPAQRNGKGVPFCFTLTVRDR